MSSRCLALIPWGIPASIPSVTSHTHTRTPTFGSYPLHLLACLWLRYHICHFDKTSNPFPQSNRWEVVERPEVPLEAGNSVYLRCCGVTTLKLVPLMNRHWRIFQCIGDDDIIEAKIAVPAKWFAT